jgi:acyl carrier protein
MKEEERSSTRFEIAASETEDDSVKERILALVVEKTGYPKDMLDLDLDLEADLGVDTVKQAEMFAAIREIYSIPRDESRKLRDYPTLAHVIRFVYEKRPDLGVHASAEPAAVGASLPATTPTSVPPVTDESIKEKVLAIVAEKTGYPKEMLDLDLDLEADLGIDTVKQAEMFAAIRATYGIPRDENLRLRDFPTLAHVIQFARDRSGTRPNAIVTTPEAASTPAPAASPAMAQAPTKKLRPVPASLEAANRIPRRVPLPVLRPPLTECKSTNVALAAGRRVVIMPDKGGVADALARMLQEKGTEVLRLDNGSDAETLTTTLKNWIASGPMDGVYWLPALDNEGNLCDMDLAAWHQAVRVRVKSLYTTMRVLYEQISKPETFFLSATRLGGQHGYDEAGAIAPLGGAVTGFTKTYKRERLDALVKAVDFELGRSPQEVAKLLVEETQRDPGAIEIGY